MPDNLAITAGSGTLIAADEISSTYYQRNKIAVGSDGTNLGDLSGRVIGTDGVINVDPRVKRVRLSSTCSGVVAAAYAADDQVGALTTLSSAFRAALSGTVTSVILVDADDAIATTAGLDLYLWESTVTLAADNAAGPGTSDADSLKLMGKIELPAPRDEVNNRICTWQGACDCVSSDTSLRWSLVTRGAFTAASTTGLTVIFTIAQD